MSIAIAVRRPSASQARRVSISNGWRLEVISIDSASVGTYRTARLKWSAAAPAMPSVITSTLIPNCPPANGSS